MKPSDEQSKTMLSGESALNDKRGKPNGMLTLFVFTVTKAKSYAFIIGMLTVALAVLCASGKIAVSPQPYGWRGLLGLLLTAVTVLGAAGLAAWGQIYKLLNRWEEEKLKSTRSNSM